MKRALRFRLVLITVASVAVLLPTAIYLHSNPETAVAANLTDYFGAKAEIAKLIQKFAIRGTDSTVTPIVLGTYKLGQVVDSDGLPYTDDCFFQDIPVGIAVPPWPRSEASSSFSLSGKLPVAFLKIETLLKSLGLDVNASKDAALEFTNLQMRVLPGDVFAARLARSPCAAKLEREGLIVVRGYIEGSERVSAGKTLSSGANVASVRNGEFKVRYEGENNFEMIHEPVVPRFFIMSTVRAIRLGGVSPDGTTHIADVSAVPDAIRETLLRAERAKAP